MPLRRNRLAPWIAAFAVLLQALWPLLSHAQPKDRTLLAPVCTIDGITHYLEIKTGKTPLEERSALHGEHCKLCFFGGDKPIGVFAPNAVVLVVADSGYSIVVSRPVACTDPASHPPAQPRAPPEIS